MIVAIDGPAGAGKSSLAKRLASTIGFAFLDTGAMYRAITWACMERSVDLADHDAVAKVAEAIDLELRAGHVVVDGSDITDQVRTPEVTRHIRPVADNPQVRRRLVELQRRIVGTADFVTEGRDQGTVAFPDAECKIFLTASPGERAARRQRQLAIGGIDRSIESIRVEQDQRDAEDIAREHGPLRAAADAVYVLTDGMSETEVLDQLVQIVNHCRRGKALSGGDRSAASGNR